MPECHDYWDSRYRAGGHSGADAVGVSKEWKWSIIDRFITVEESDVLDVGCGDMRFWEGRDCRKYMGMDFSEGAIEKAIELLHGLQLEAATNAPPDVRIEIGVSLNASIRYWKREADDD